MNQRVTQKGPKSWDAWQKRILNEALMQNNAISLIPEIIRNVYTQHPVKIKSDVDFCMGIKGQAVWFDAKECQAHLWNLKQYVFDEKKIHQWSKLLTVDRCGSKAGFLVWFSKLNKISWVSVAAIELAVKEERCSIHPESPLVVSQTDEEPIHFGVLINDP